MSSRSARAALVAALVMTIGPAVRAAEPAPDLRSVEAAVEKMRADPALGGMKTERQLRFKSSGTAASAPARRNEPLPAWLVDLLRWIAEGGRVGIWFAGAAALAIVLVLARRWMQVRGRALPDAALARPSHVRDLDIRPESLPPDIGEAVRALWLAGEQRAALSLLYRGALSRLVHGHAVMIDEAATEGDCLRLANGSLPREGGEFFARLVRAWQFAVYGGHPPAAAEVMALCDGFDRELGTSTGAPG